MSEPKPGDRVTPENVAGLPIGTVVEYDCGDRRLTATKIGPDTWEDSDGDVLDDDTLADPNETPAVLVSPNTPKADPIAAALAIYDAGGSRDEMAAALRGAP